MEVAQLKQTLSKIEVQNVGTDWLKRLNERKRTELEFHNRDRDKSLTESLPQDIYELLHGNKKFYSTVALSQSYIDMWLTNKVKGKIFLDYACGNGLMAIKAANKGAALSIGLDISDVSVRNARESAEKSGLAGITYFIQGDCENTGLPDNCLDVILCSGMLHHLDLSYALPELRRILKPGGLLLAVEALDYNPLIKLYRRLTPSMRTEWEKNHILSLKDVAFASRFFEVGEIRYWHVLSPLAAYASWTIGLFNFLDQILTRIPLIRLLSWQFTFELRKPVNS